MKKILSILSLLTVAIIFGTSLNGCSKDNVTTNNNNTNTTDSTDNNSNNSDTTTCSECIVCDDYEVGDTFTVNGVTYTVADREMLDEAILRGRDVTKYCTSKVTKMNELFNNFSGESFNQDISKWDVSNVTIMSGMFFNAELFNQDIGNWDVSNVKSMHGMLRGTSSFNHDLTQWCVPNIDSEPGEFSLNSALTPENHPVWGTCP